MFDFFKKHWKTVLLGLGTAALVVAGSVIGAPVWLAAMVGGILGVVGLGAVSLLGRRKFSLLQFATAALIGAISGGLILWTLSAVGGFASTASIDGLIGAGLIVPPIVPPVALWSEGTPGPAPTTIHGAPVTPAATTAPTPPTTGTAPAPAASPPDSTGIIRALTGH